MSMFGSWEVLAVISILVWMTCGALGAVKAEMNQQTHPGAKLLFAWLLALVLGPVCLAVVLLSTLDD